MTISPLQVSWDGGLATLANALNAWSPTEVHTEERCQAQLAEFVRGIAPSARVEREFAHLGCKVDLYVRINGVLSFYEVLLEAKLNLASENEYKRLVGQIETMEPDRHLIIVVLFGTTKPEFISRLREKYRRYFNGLTQDSMALIEKPFP